MALSEAPSGRGFYSDQFYFLPTLGAELLKIDLAKGEIVQRAGTALVLGNLVCFRDEILSQGPDCLSVFWQSEPLRRHVEKALAEKPDDVAALAKYGELLLQEGKRPQAIETFRKAHQLSPGDETVRLLLSNAILTSLREDFAASAALAPEVERLIDRPSQQSEYLRIMAGGWQRQGALKKAFDAYLELAKLRADLQNSGGAAEMELERVDRNWNIRADLWLQARIGELLRTASGAELAAMDQTIQQAFDQALAGGEVAALRKAERLFGMHARAEEIRLTLARRLVKSGELLEAELLLSRLEESENAAVRAAAVAELADLMVLTRQYDVALRYYRTLADGYGDTVCRDGKTGRQLFEQAAATAVIREAIERSQPWPAGKAEVSDSQERVSQNVSYRRVFACADRQRTGPCPHGPGGVLRPNSQCHFDSRRQRECDLECQSGQPQAGRARFQSLAFPRPWSLAAGFDGHGSRGDRHVAGRGRGWQAGRSHPLAARSGAAEHGGQHVPDPVAGSAAAAPLGPESAGVRQSAERNWRAPPGRCWIPPRTLSRAVR